MRKYKAGDPKYPQPGYPHYLVAVDLGKTKLGVAVFDVDSRGQARLYWAGTLTATKRAAPEEVASLVTSSVDFLVARSLTSKVPVLWVCEWPQKYDTKRKYHEDLEALHAVGRVLPPWSEKYRPREWKAQVPKKPHHRRIRRELLQVEKEAMQDRNHDTLDAIGIGLFATARHRRGGLPNGT
tara:strand:+ start:3126 stop:3671 length:546 start_codon:yes stop_codon:yes gene_type:complete